MRRTSIALFFALAIVLAGAAIKPAWAQLDDLNGSHDSQAPIEITADTLEVRQSDNLAIFRGDVDAILSGLKRSAGYIRGQVSRQVSNGISRQPQRVSSAMSFVTLTKVSQAHSKTVFC